MHECCSGIIIRHKLLNQLYALRFSPYHLNIPHWVRMAVRRLVKSSMGHGAPIHISRGCGVLRMKNAIRHWYFGARVLLHNLPDEWMLSRIAIDTIG